VLWETWTELYRIEGCCGNCGQNYTGVKGVVGTVDRIILQ
jgi:hypothetical protein